MASIQFQTLRRASEIIGDDKILADMLARQAALAATRCLSGAATSPASRQAAPAPAKAVRRFTQETQARITGYTLSARRICTTSFLRLQASLPSLARHLYMPLV
jgi:hypothetical protein